MHEDILNPPTMPIYKVRRFSIRIEFLPLVMWLALSHHQGLFSAKRSVLLTRFILYSLETYTLLNKPWKRPLFTPYQLKGGFTSLGIPLVITPWDRMSSVRNSAAIDY